MSALSDIRMAAKSSGIATLADARGALGKASELLHAAYGVLERADFYTLDADVDDQQDGDAATLRGALRSLLDQANAYAQKIYALVDIGEGPIDGHTQEQVVAALALAKKAYERVQDAVNDPSLQIDFTDAVMEGVQIAAGGLTGLAKAAGAGVAQAALSLWWIVIPGVAILAWWLFFRKRGT